MSHTHSLGTCLCTQAMVLVEWAISTMKSMFFTNKALHSMHKVKHIVSLCNACDEKSFVSNLQKCIRKTCSYETLTKAEKSVRSTLWNQCTVEPSENNQQKKGLYPFFFFFTLFKLQIKKSVKLSSSQSSNLQTWQIFIVSFEAQIQIPKGKALWNQKWLKSNNVFECFEFTGLIVFSAIDAYDKE